MPRLVALAAMLTLAIGFVARDGACAGAISGMPLPETTLQLSGGSYIHIQELPLGIMPAAIVGNASFESGGSRAVFVAAFHGAALYGDSARMDPSQAYLLDMRRRRLTQLTSDGLVVSARWSSAGSLVIRDGAIDETLRLSSDGGIVRSARPTSLRFSPDQSLAGSLDDVTPDNSGYLSIFRRADGTYIVRQAGARRPVEGVADNGAYALIGDALAWIDRTSQRAPAIERAGAIDALPPRFDDAFGRMRAPIAPLGRAVYQGAYRDGVAYFVLSYGLTRVVVATRDFVTYWYPPRPVDPAYSVGDGFGALAHGRLYLAWPEGLALTLQRSGDYVSMPMVFPANYSDVQPLIAAIDSRRRAGALWPALMPDSDALDAALLQWRVYPAGAADATHWVASYLGRTYIGDKVAHFVRSGGPVFPFAILSRTDDGTLWGASPVACSSASSSCPAGSLLWSSSDGAHWRPRYSLDGSAGAVGGVAGDLWVAQTRAANGVPDICLASLGDNANPTCYSTGGTYGGEQMFFANVVGGDYLVWGVTPGRAAGGQGTLSAFRIDRARLAADTGAGLNVFSRARAAGSEPNAFTGFGDAAMLETTSDELRSSSNGQRAAVLATDIAGARAPMDLTLRTESDELRWEAEFGARPEPLGVVSAQPYGAGAIVTRAIWRAPLRGNGETELWERGADGLWHFTQTLHSWAI